jgi:hypothetical protein
MIKKQFMTIEEMVSEGFCKLKTLANGKDVYVLIEDNNGIIQANLYIWGPAFESYFLVGALGYCDMDLFEMYIEKDVEENLPR